MKVYKIILKPKSILKEIPSSETIFGAICWGIHHIYSEINLQEKLNDFGNWDKRFVPSSAFPLLKSAENEIYCFPKPLLPDPRIDEMERVAENYKNNLIEKTNNEKIKVKDERQYVKRAVINKYKEIKEVKYLSENLFNLLINCENLTTLLCLALENKLMRLRDMLLTTEEFEKIKEENLLEKRASLRNKIDRLSFSTLPGGELYYEYEIYINRKVFNLYFLFLTDDIDFFVPIFRWLQDTGIGGNRTTGRGYFEISKLEGFTLPNINNSNFFIPLSKYLPAKGEIEWQSKNNHYELMPYKPRFDTMFFKGGEFIKNEVTYLKEGSVLQAREKKEFYGVLYPSAKFQDKTIYQCGLAIPFFIKMEAR
jgi:CRISPR-associated protein Csm4